MKTVNQYSGDDLAFVIPTKDRPRKIEAFLQSVLIQEIKPHRIIFVDSGESIEGILNRFKDRINVEYYRAQNRGQIAQRNEGIAKLDSSTPLVAFFDDDIILNEGSLKSIITFINNAPKNTAGVGFNITNMPANSHSWPKGLLGISGPDAGKILKSGANTPTSGTPINLETNWLCGGATIWKFEVIQEFSHRAIETRWASCEDIIFSYPIGKKYPLFVCADAKVIHDHHYDHTGNARFVYYGKTETLWRMYFVDSNSDLSILAFLKMILSLTLARIVLGLMQLKAKHFQFAIGQVFALLIGMQVLFGLKQWKDVLVDK
ncbi:MAG: glycosyltransferase [Bacteriovoracaceae bacterium]|nr:glycosyltransferase [Bacteriovoracaceae bacterium]